jgi:hypothetical protein
MTTKPPARNVRRQKQSWKRRAPGKVTSQPEEMKKKTLSLAKAWQKLRELVYPAKKHDESNPFVGDDLSQKMEAVEFWRSEAKPVVLSRRVMKILKARAAKAKLADDQQAA